MERRRLVVYWHDERISEGQPITTETSTIKCYLITAMWLGVWLHLLKPAALVENGAFVVCMWYFDWSISQTFWCRLRTLTMSHLNISGWIQLYSFCFILSVTKMILWMRATNLSVFFFSSRLCSPAFCFWWYSSWVHSSVASVLLHVHCQWTSSLLFEMKLHREFSKKMQQWYIIKSSKYLYRHLHG